MKRLSLFLGLIILAFSACQKDAETITIDSALPQGTFAVIRQGSITEQNSTGSKGTVQIGQDSKSIHFLKFGSDFTTVLATGTVTVYFSTSNTFKADPAKGNPDLKLAGTVVKNGEMYIKLTGPIESKFTHLILWCGSANIPFGNATLN